jgi:hypothetical protein
MNTTNINENSLTGSGGRTRVLKGSIYNDGKGNSIFQVNGADNMQIIRNSKGDASIFSVFNK